MSRTYYGRWPTIFRLIATEAPVTLCQSRLLLEPQKCSLTFSRLQQQRREWTTGDGLAASESLVNHPRESDDGSGQFSRNNQLRMIVLR